jgi:hypothetical protein
MSDRVNGRAKISRKATRSRVWLAAVFAALVTLGCSGLSVTPTVGVQPTA